MQYYSRYNTILIRDSDTNILPIIFVKDRVVCLYLRSWNTHTRKNRNKVPHQKISGRMRSPVFDGLDRSSCQSQGSIGNVYKKPTQRTITYKV